jgi:hypothetical protein
VLLSVFALALVVFGQCVAEENAETVPLPDDPPVKDEAKEQTGGRGDGETGRNGDAETRGRGDAEKQSRERQAKSEEPAAQVVEPADTEEPKAKSQEPRAKSEEPKAGTNDPPTRPAAPVEVPVAVAPTKDGPPKPPDLPTPPNPKPTDPPPGAELVPLPPEKPVDLAAPVPLPPTAGVDKESPTLTTDTQQVAPGQQAVFSLYGPETFLRAATATYVLRDELGRQLAAGEMAVKEMPYTEGQPRQLRIPVLDPLACNHELELVLTAPGGQRSELRGRFSVPLLQPKWEHWIALVATPPVAPASVPAGSAMAGTEARPTGWPALRALGISGGMQYRLHAGRRDALRKGQAAFYVENIARQLLSRYHTERGLWEQTIAAIAKDPGDHAALRRDPSLWAPEFAEALAKELKRHAEVYAKDPPLFYSLACEPSVTRLSAAADFDFSPAAIQEFQRWLERDVYGTVKALNTSWGTAFKSWNEVVPMTTDEARLRLNDGVLNFGPWVDFREFQDFTFSKVLRDAGEFVRGTDPAAKVGITGALGAFAFGGWDWSRLSKSLDVVECYDIGGARALWRDLAPGKPALAVISLSEVAPASVPAAPDAGATAAEKISAEARSTIWKFALEGGPRGVLIWDDAPSAAPEQASRRALLNEDGQPSELAKSLSPTLKTLDGEVGALLATCERVHDGVGVLYSPASVRVNWLLEAQRLHGAKWLDAWGADSSGERRESPQLRLRESWSKLLDDLGLTWRYVSSAQVETGGLAKPDCGIKTLVLPRTIALSDREIEGLKQFVARGGKLVADATCGRFDEHGKLREKPALDELLLVDTSSEPSAPEPMNPLERVKGAQSSGVALQVFSHENIANLAPVFSDKPKLPVAKPDAAANPQSAIRNPQWLEYRRSPVLAQSPAGVFLNLDLTDYLRWRLHPDQPRAKAVREVIAAVAFADRLNETLVDLSKSSIPLGTELVWLEMKSQEPRAKSQEQVAPRVLALRRNPQARLHELGTEVDGNWAFEKTEAFSLALRKPVFVTALPSGARSGGAVQKIEGQLDPTLPSLLIVNAQPAQAPVVSAPATVQTGDAFEVSVKPNAKAAALYSMHVFAPDGVERTYHALTKHSADGVLTCSLRLALNEAPGNWKVIVRDLGQGTEGAASFEVKAGLVAEHSAAAAK